MSATPPNTPSTPFPIQPIGTKLVLQPQSDDQTESGLLLAGSQNDRVGRGVIVAGLLDQCPSCKTLYSPGYGVGTVVMYQKHAGEPIQVDGSPYLLIDATAILAIVHRSASDGAAQETAS